METITLLFLFGVFIIIAYTLGLKNGGINDKTIKLLKDVDIAVVGSYITTSDNMIEKVKTLV